MAYHGSVRNLSFPSRTPATIEHAKKIVDTVKGMDLSERAQIIAVATAMQESNLRNLASMKLPESYK